MPESVQSAKLPACDPPALLAAPPLPHPTTASPDSGALPLPPTVTPATTTRQSVALGVFSTLWGTNTSAGPTTSPLTTLPTFTTTHDSPSDLPQAGGPSDLTASTGSVPSATTTLTNTLPATQSAALRALNAPAFHAAPKPAKSTSSRTTVTSQPVVVRTYSGSRYTSRPDSGFTTPRSHAMNGGSAPLSANWAARTDQLPAADDFSFSAILRAVDPEIRDAIDAIAEICARSRMSLADEYDSHLPPQGEITGPGSLWATTNTGGRGRLARVNQGWAAENNMLMAVPEASSSSERLAQESKVASSKKRSQSAYGSLKSVISGGSGKRKALDGDTFRDLDKKPAGSAGTANPAITLVTSPTASKHLSLESPTGLDGIVEEGVRPRTARARNAGVHRRGVSTASLPTPRPRSGTLSSITSWLPWPWPPDLSASNQHDVMRAETRLREMLLSSENVLGKGKTVVSVV